MITLRYADQPHALIIAMDTTAPRTSTSGRYLTCHLPRTSNPAKLVLSCNDDPAQITILHDLEGDGVIVEALFTAGASAYDVALSITLDGRYAGAHGVTGQTIAATVVGS